MLTHAHVKKFYLKLFDIYNLQGHVVSPIEIIVMS